MKLHLCLIVLCGCLFNIGCKSNFEKDDIDRIVIRLEGEPARINPILCCTSIETEVNEYIFLSLGDFDPVTLEMIPVLIEDLPETSKVDEGEYLGYNQYSMEILNDASWPDGRPITGYDVEFTFKLAFHPGVASSSWKQLLNNVEDVEIDPDNPKKFTIVSSSDYFLDTEAILTAELLPRQFYDFEDVLGDYSLHQMKDEKFTDSLSQANDEFNQLGIGFSSSKFSRDKIMGSGPYDVVKWETGQYIILKRKENWWGSKYDNSYLKAYPTQIIFQIVQDHTTAITQLKNNELDIVSLSKAPFQLFNDLKSDVTFSKQFNFYTPEIFRFYYVVLNNEDVRLSELSVRRALALALPVDRIVNQLEGGYGKRVNSPIHPGKIESNTSLLPVAYDVEKAKTLLKENGWIDSDGNGIRDKVINNKKEELNLRYFITGSTLSQSISTIMKESVSQIGVHIEIVTKNYGKTFSENLLPGDYELSTFSTTQSAALSDPYIYWHSHSIGNNGRNLARYSNREADQLMEKIRRTKNDDERMNYYMRFQEVFYSNQPVIFLYSPVERYVVSSKFVPVISSKKPGYFANAFVLSP